MFVIPAIDLIQGRCVRLYQGDYSQKTVYNTSPARQALRFQEAGFTRLHVVDLEGARWGQGHNRQAIREIIQSVDISVQVGGGIRSERDIGELKNWGVRYQILGTAALTQPANVDRWVDRWGAQTFIVSLDFREGKILSQGWSEENQTSLNQILERIHRWGLSQIICTDVTRDGTLQEPNYQTYQQLLSQLSPDVRLIAAGGVSRREHLDRLRKMGLAKAIMGKALYETKVSLEEFSGVG